jgi:hypothetical protein
MCVWGGGAQGPGVAWGWRWFGGGGGAGGVSARTRALFVCDKEYAHDLSWPVPTGTSKPHACAPVLALL